MTAAQQPDLDLGQAAPYDHALHCMAGFFTSQEQAQAAAHQLRQRHGLHDEQGLLLGPAHKSWLSFRRQARSWAMGRHTEGQSGLADARLMATCGGVIVGLAMLIGIAVLGVPDEGLALLLLTGPLIGAAVGWLASTINDSSAQQRRFNHHIRRQLAAGRWVVLAHRLPWQQQAGAAALLRQQGVGWCAVSAPWRPL